MSRKARVGSIPTLGTLFSMGWRFGRLSEFGAIIAIVPTIVPTARNHARVLREPDTTV